MDEHVDYPEFLTRLRRLVEEEATATLRVVTEDRHFVNVGVHRGRILALYHGPRRGLAAIPRIARMGRGALTLIQAEEFRPQDDLPPTREILQLLEKGGADLPLAQVRHAPPPARPPRDEVAPDSESSTSDPLTQPIPSLAPPPTPPIHPTVSAADLHRIEETLLHYIGPIARMIVKDALNHGGAIDSRKDLEGFAEELSREIEDPAEARRFLDQALGRG